jgi:hypothetical protein
LIYGIDLTNTRPQLVKKDLASVSGTLSIVLLILQVIYAGNDLMYKVDNAFIMAQTVYYFLYSKGVLDLGISQFFYGWIFAHLGFFPNLFENSIPP